MIIVVSQIMRQIKTNAENKIDLLLRRINLTRQKYSYNSEFKKFRIVTIEDIFFYVLY